MADELKALQENNLKLQAEVKALNERLKKVSGETKSEIRQMILDIKNLVSDNNVQMKKLMEDVNPDDPKPPKNPKDPKPEPEPEPEDDLPSLF